MFREFTDVDTQRQQVFDNTLAALGTKFPIENDLFRLELANTRYERTKPFSLVEQKKAILDRRSLDWPIKGTWRLIDKANEQVVSEADKVVARVPYLTQRGTYIYNGTEYTLANQQRLRPGIFTRVKDNGEIEAHVNLTPGTGRSFRIFMDPKTGVYRFHIGQANVPAFAVMKALGATDDELKKAWGEQLYKVNSAKGHDFDLSKTYERLANAKIRKKFRDVKEGLRATFDAMVIDPEVSKRTLGQPFDRVNKDALLRATEKILNINRGAEDPDDRDSQAHQILMSAEDLIPERITKDAGGLSRNLLWKLTRTKDTNKIPSSYLSKQVNSALLSSGLGMPLQEINPIEILDQLTRISRLGEGGIPNVESVPDEARNVQPSQLGFIDIIKGPESNKIGVDTRAAVGTFKGSDNKLYRTVNNIRTGKSQIVSAEQITDSVMAFPGEFKKDTKKVRALVGGKVRYVDRNEVDFELPSGNDMFSYSLNLVPAISGVKGQRALMAGKMFSQALPLRNPEAPLVRSALPDGSGTYESLVGKFTGNINAADKAGVVTKVTKDKIIVDYGGKKQTHELYNDFPFNYKTFIHNTAIVKPGDKIAPGQLLAHSNFTDVEGTLAMGLNLRSAFLSSEGNYEDGIVISESAAKRLSSEHMFTRKLSPKDDGVDIGTAGFVSKFPTKFNRRQLKTIDKDGLVKPGTVLRKDDPIILATRTREPTRGTAISRQRKTWINDASVVWEHEDEGIVTDISNTREGVKVAIKSYSTMNVGDKLSGRWGNKGVIGKILPDAQMPRDKNDIPYEILLNPLGIISRVNPSQLVEVAMGKLARKTGKPISLPAFTDENMARWALKQLADNDIPETEKIYDPHTKRWLSNVFTGEQFFMKLHHVAESKISGRDTGNYTLEGAPAKGGPEGAKRLGNLDIAALIAHGTPEIIKDAKLVRGQRNEDYWRKLQMGLPTGGLETPFVYDKFLAMLQAAGINTKRSAQGITLSSMTDDDVDALAEDRELRNGNAINLKDESPVPGGLFDMNLTGGKEGNRWAKITLSEALPHPVMEEPIRRLLDLTKPKFEELMRTPDGPRKIQQQLKQINIDNELESAYITLKGGKTSKRDAAIKKIRILDSARRTGIHPRQYMISKVPVLPPQFRPITMMKGIELTSDANLLYKDLFDSNKAFSEIRNDLEDIGDERMAVYNSLKAVTGLGDPISPEHQKKRVAGMLAHVFGKGSPKLGMFQRKIMSTTVDSVARAAITPDPKLDMDQVGLPENVAWKVYKPYIMRRLSRKYNSGSQSVPLTELAKWVANKDPRAKDAMLEEMKVRPVIYNRAPVLHKFGVMGAWPMLTAGDTLKISPIMTAGFGADFDGDAMNFHVPSSDEAVAEVKEKLMPSKNLLSTNEFDVHLEPRQEYLLGLYLATRKQKDTKKKAPRIFKDKRAAIDAYLNGELGINDPVTIR